MLNRSKNEVRHNIRVEIIDIYRNRIIHAAFTEITRLEERDRQTDRHRNYHDLKTTLSEGKVRFERSFLYNGIIIGGSKISNLIFADDTTLIAASQEKLVALLNVLEQHSAAYGLGINYNKTKVMIVDREHDNHREIKSIGRCEVVQSFVCLGSLIDNSGSCENEIRRRIQQARVAMTKLTKIWRDDRITKATKMSLVQSLVFSIVLYASETWTVKKAEETILHCVYENAYIPRTYTQKR
ncbi:unnamed protein product [Callosobruchus maculatus]|uniref:Reverse transcriptase domain-containing protein n=1 Tax=Callosobruchus maculatus TaxID=64391 RepID=A0A653DIY5_CALMS|nr:unnamed protein product [Callosobruchus maculatus]